MSASVGLGTPGSGAPGGTGSTGTSGASASGTGAPGGAAGGANGGSGAPNSGGPTGTASAGVGAPGGPQGACQLRLALTSGSPVYANGTQPSFSVAVVNQGSVDCTADLGGKSLILTVFSGAERIWSTADCGDGKSDLRAIAPGDIQQITVTWPRVRSSAGCPVQGPAGQAGLGTYYAQVTLATGAGPTAAAFSSSQQSFQLKSGS